MKRHRFSDYFFFFNPFNLIYPIVFGLFVYAIVYINQKSTEASGQIQNKYSAVEMENFWKKELLPILSDSKKYPAVEERSSQLINGLRADGLVVKLVPVGHYHRNSERCVASASINTKTKEAEIAYFLPAITDIKKELMEENDFWEERFRSMVLISALHELEHLAYNQCEKNWQGIPREFLSEYESSAWFRTCAHTINPLVEKYKVRLTSSHESTYREWLRCGKDISNKSWLNYFQRIYTY